MAFRTRYKLRAIPLLLTVSSAIVVLAMTVVQHVGDWLEQQLPMLSLISLIVASIMPLTFTVWYLLSYAEIRRGRLKVRGLRGSQEVDLRSLVEAELFDRGRSSSKRKQHDLLIRLRDDYHEEIWLPLSSWRDEDLLMALVLRASVDRKVKIMGDPAVVKRFSGLLGTYKSCDRQLRTRVA